jgi:hypothetical protein
MQNMLTSFRIHQHLKILPMHALNMGSGFLSSYCSEI